MKQKKNSPLAVLLFVVIFLVGGYLAKVYITDDLISESKASKDWPSVQGKITESDLESERRDGKTHYSIQLEYEYKVNNVSYYSNNIRVVDSGSSTSKASMKNTIRAYPEGKSVKVYYDPEFPETAVLKTGTSLLYWFLLRLPYLAMALGALLAIGLIKDVIKIFI